MGGWRCVLHCLWVKAGSPHGPSLCEAAEQETGGVPEVPPRSASVAGPESPGGLWLSVTLPSLLLMVPAAGRCVGSVWAPFPVGLHQPLRRAQHGTYEWARARNPRDVPCSSPEHSLCTPGLAGGPHSDSVTMNPCAEPPLVALKMGRPKYSMLRVRGAQSCGPGGVCRVAVGRSGHGPVFRPSWRHSLEAARPKWRAALWFVGSQKGCTRLPTPSCTSTCSLSAGGRSVLTG